ncbi:methylthioribulose-1-phosphate dehydratase [Rhizoctonia solani]|uniref:Methylthioribulose-1-phosphate dehydratase n=1 Tax=Rhizoctonia solani TaxID=456999 RepID=A0A0K6FR77_9AGAM|nr:methylthioribulose-1-phosphate dehydratase [Rhizoctonia solani]
MADFFVASSAAAPAAKRVQEPKTTPSPLADNTESVGTAKGAGSNFSMLSLIPSSPDVVLLHHPSLKLNHINYSHAHSLANQPCRRPPVRNGKTRKKSLRASPLTWMGVDRGEEAMSLLIKAQATAAKNKKAKETQCLNGTKEILDGVLQACAQDYAEGIAELENLYSAFQMELAASYDRERKHWLEAVAEQETFQSSLEELIKAYQESEETREKEHIEALALARSGINNAKSVVNKHLQNYTQSTLHFAKKILVDLPKKFALRTCRKRKPTRSSNRLIQSTPRTSSQSYAHLGTLDLQILDLQKPLQSPEGRTLLARGQESRLYHLGWVTGTGGGISIRQGDKVYIAPSGVQKERIKPEHIFVLPYPRPSPETFLRKPTQPLKESACTPLFWNAFDLRGAGSCVHTHSQHAVMATLLWEGETWEVSHLEMIKGVRDAGTGKALSYLDTVVVPIIENTPFEEDLKDSMAEAMKKYPNAAGVLVRRHGVYVWGTDWEKAKTQTECLDYLFEVSVKMKLAGLPTKLG